LFERLPTKFRGKVEAGISLPHRNPLILSRTHRGEGGLLNMLGYLDAVFPQMIKACTKMLVEFGVAPQQIAFVEF